MHSLHISNEHNYVINKLTKTPINNISDIVKLSVQCLEENNYQKINLQTLSNKLNVNLQETEDIFGILLMLIRRCQQRRSLSDKEVKNELIEQGFSGEWANNFYNLVMHREDEIQCYNRIMLQMNYNWCIDISLYNNALNRAISPIIIWNLKLNNDKQYTIEINIKKFHEIRFNISTILKELSLLKQYNLVKK